MSLLQRNPKNCAALFAWFEILFLVGFISVPLTVFVSEEFLWLQLVVAIVFLLVTGLLAYQIGYHPLVAALWSAALLIPIGSLVVVIILFIQTRTFLRKCDYRIGLWGAKPISDIAATAG